jgi:hypothetical protein
VVAYQYDSKGIFSLRSAYKVQREHDMRRSQHGAPSSSNGQLVRDDDMWKGPWKIKCLGKIKHFLWRLAHNSTAL